MAKKSSKKSMTIEDLALMIQRNVAMKEDLKGFATKEDLKNFATKDDIKGLRKEMHEGFTDIHQKMATKDDITALENKLIEDTGAVTGVEQKHHRSHAQRIARLEKEVFPEAA